MKIGILTFHNVLNYGALLQLFALQERLKDLGHNPVVLNISTFQRNKHPLISGYGLRRGQFLRALKNKPLDFIKYSRFKNFRKKYLKITKPIKSLNDFQKSNHKVDAIIVGSDQVWNDKYGMASINLYTLKDLKSIDTINLSYAASSGKLLSQNSIIEAFSFSKFHAISVRDRFTQKLISKRSDLESQIVVDPTLLINWSNFPIDAKRVNVPLKYIFVYGLSEEAIESALEVKKILDLPIVGIPMEGEYGNIHLDYCVLDAGIGEWLNLIRNAEFVCTKSFHGMMLSIQFKRPFLMALGSSFASERLNDFMERFCLTERVFNKVSKYKLASIIELGNKFYDKLDNKLSNAVRESEKFLIDSLSLK